VAVGAVVKACVNVAGVDGMGIARCSGVVTCHAFLGSIKAGGRMRHIVAFVTRSTENLACCHVSGGFCATLYVVDFVNKCLRVYRAGIDATGVTTGRCARMAAHATPSEVVSGLFGVNVVDGCREVGINRVAFGNAVGVVASLAGSGSLQGTSVSGYGCACVN
jgi:hypothetical protein